MAAKDWLDEGTAVEENIGLVRWIVARHPSRRFHDEEDLFAAGLEGLLRGIRTFDPDRGKFAPHVALQIRQGISHHLRDVEGNDKYPKTHARRRAIHVALDEPVGPHGRPRYELIASHDPPVENCVIGSDLRPARHILRGLTGNDQRQLKAFDLLAEGHTKKWIAEQVGVSLSRVIQWTKAWARSRDLREALCAA